MVQIFQLLVYLICDLENVPISPLWPLKAKVIDLTDAEYCSLDEVGSKLNSLEKEIFYHRKATQKNL